MHSDLMPTVWGSGQLLAFSGVDGATSWAEPFVLATGTGSGDLDLKLPVALPIRFPGLGAVQWRLLLGDALLGMTSRGAFAAAFADRETLLGEVPDGVVVEAGGQAVGPVPTAVANGPGWEIMAWQTGTRWGLSRAADAAAWLAVPLAELIDRRAAFVAAVSLPTGLSPERIALLRKAVSVMKVNVHSANGTIRRRWSTPDRWPHRHMWLWDSAFHAIGMAAVDVELAQDELLAMLEQVLDDGMLPHMVQADGRHSSVTQPPLLAWAVDRLLEHGGDTAWARACIPFLRRYLHWDLAHRDRNRNHIPEWHIEGNPLCRCGESGLDNSSVYDRAVLLDAPDFAAFLFNDLMCLARLGERLGDAALVDESQAAAAPIARAVEALLWDDAQGFYFHRDFDGNLVPVKAVSGFMPLFAGIPSAARARRLASHLDNPATFGAPARVPSEALDSGTFCKDMWRGPAWMNLSCLIVLGLRRYGLVAEAESLKESILETVEHWYRREGCIFEYYDALNLTSPRGLDRKQRLATGKGIAPIADYHWTAAVTAMLLLE